MLTLMDAHTFPKVSISAAKTLQWKSIKRPFTWKGETRYKAVELDPYVLFERSVLIRKEDPTFVSAEGKKSRASLITKAYLAQREKAAENKKVMVSSPKKMRQIPPVVAD